jgi:hypothetical protein
VTTKYNRKLESDKSEQKLLERMAIGSGHMISDKNRKVKNHNESQSEIT